ncbi:MAG TPA: hypothetical protein VGI83_07810 [Gemmatimonadales bacterium]
MRRLAVVLTLALPLRLFAQGAPGDSALARGDTAGAIAAYESAVARNTKDAESHYRAGVLRMARFVHHTGRGEDVGKATGHFEAAAHLEPDSAKYWLAWADAERTHSGLRARIQVPQLVDKALEVSRKHGGGAAAEAEYRAARIDWERAELRSHAYRFISSQTTMDAMGIAGDWHYAEQFFATAVRPDVEDRALGDRQKAENHVRAAVAQSPAYVNAAGLLVVMLGDQSRWEEAYEVARGVVRAAPDSGGAYAILGLVQARMGRWREAQNSYVRALTHMSPGERAPYDNLTLILRQADSARLAAEPHSVLLGTDSLYWVTAQPLFLDDVNQPKVEFFARLTYVIHRWSDPLRGYQGYESERGRVFVRYGPPDIWATFGREGVSSANLTNATTGDSTVTEVHIDPLGTLEAEGTTIAWVYHRAHLGFVFSVTPGFTKDDFSGDVGTIYDEARNVAPVRFDNVPAVRNMDTVDIQAVQFRGDSASRTDVAVYGLMPIGRMVKTAANLQMDLQTAAIVRDTRMHEVARERQDVRIQGGDTVQIERRSWRLGLAPQDYLLRVEARLPVLDRSARGAMDLNVRSFDGDTLMLSDVLVAGRITPRDSSASKWSDYFIEPSSGRFGPRQPVGLLWEIYNLAPDSTGVARYKVDVRVGVKEIERHGFVATVLGGLKDAIGVSARGDDAAALTFQRQTPAQRHGREVEYLTLDLQNVPNATYDVAVTITDLVANRVAVSNTRRLTVTPAALGQ